MPNHTQFVSYTMDKALVQSYVCRSSADPLTINVTTNQLQPTMAQIHVSVQDAFDCVSESCATVLTLLGCVELHEIVLQYLANGLNLFIIFTY